MNTEGLPRTIRPGRPRFSTSHCRGAAGQVAGRPRRNTALLTDGYPPFRLDQGDKEPYVPSRPSQKRTVRHPLGATRPTPRPPGPGHGGDRRPSGEVAMTEVAAGNSIVVGVDGSEASQEALRWAAGQAHALHTNVVAVHAWEPTGLWFAPYVPASARPTAAEQRGQAARLLASTLREVFGPRIATVDDTCRTRGRGGEAARAGAAAAVARCPAARPRAYASRALRPAHDGSGGTCVPAACDSPRGRGARRAAARGAARRRRGALHDRNRSRTTDSRRRGTLHRGFDHAVIAGRPPSGLVRRDR